MTPDEELAVGDYEDDRNRRGLRWLPAVVLAVALAVVAWLIWTYSDFGRAPDQPDVAGGETAAISVPDVVGMTRGQAVAALEAAGFATEVEVSYDALAEAGSVVSQDPAAGAKATAGSTVFIGVAEGVVLGGDLGAGQDRESTATPVPDVVGMSESQATSALRLNGFDVAVSELYTEKQPEGLVFEQTPSGGSAADPGTTVGILVSLGRSQAADRTVPDLLGLSRSEAEARIVAAGFEPRVMVQPKRDRIGIVYEQQPLGGTAAKGGSYVFILVGSRP